MKVTSEYFDRPVERRGTNSYKWDLPAGEDIIPMWVADMDFNTAPPVIEAIRRRAEHGVYGYVTVPEDFYRATVDWFDKRHAWRIKRESLLYTTGVVPAISVIIKALTMPGDKVLMMTPVYNCFFSSIANNGCQVDATPLLQDGASFSIDWNDLEHRAADPRTRILLLCNPHNPVGRVWTREELERLGELCRRNGLIAISDEIHCELVAPGHQYTPFASLEGHEDFTITCVSPSKAFNIAGLKIASIVCDNPQWRERIDRAININEVCDVNPFGVEAYIAAYTQGGPWIDALCDYIYANYCLLRDFFARHFGDLLTVAKLEGTYLAWVDCRRLGLSSKQLADTLLDRARVLFSDGAIYGSADGFIRVNLACPRARVVQALDRVKPVLDDLSRR